MISDLSFVMSTVGVVATLLVLGIFMGAAQGQGRRGPYRDGRE